MGVDLRLLPVECDQPGLSYSHTVLNCERRWELFEELMQLPAEPLSPTFQTYLSREGGAGPHYGDTPDTPYGERLTAVPVRLLWPFAHHPDVQDDYMNRAIWAYLACLPADMRIALYWN